MAYIDGKEVLFSSQINLVGDGIVGSVTVDTALSATSTNPVQNKVVKRAIDELSGRTDALEAQMEELLYKAISILSFSHNVGIKEIGSTVTSVTLTWATNKTPTMLTLDGTAIGVGLTSKTFTGLAITHSSNKSWTLVAKDEKNSDSKTIAIAFCNGIYYGVGTQEKDFTSAFVTGLTKKLQASKAYDFTVNPNSQYIYYAVPKSRGTVSFKVGGFEGGFEAPKIVSVTNSSEYTEDYYVYRSTNKITGSTSVDVI